MDTQLDHSLSQSESNLQVLQKIIAEDKPVLTEADYDSVRSTYNKLEQCRQHRKEAADEIARLERMLAGWRNFLDYQDKREPVLARKYQLVRDAIRATEDEQTGL